MRKGKTMHQWQRVSGPDLDGYKKERTERNKGILNSKEFQEACKRAGIEATKRQASKWANRKGLTYKLFKILPSIPKEAA